MISRLQVLHYRALKYIDIKLSNFQILIGPNASGKSTFLDVINLINDLLNIGPEEAIKKRANRFDELIWKNEGNQFEIAIELDIPDYLKNRLKDKNYSKARYEISIQCEERSGVNIAYENLWLIKEKSSNGDFFDLKNNESKYRLFPDEKKEPEHIISLFRGKKRTIPGWRKIISKSNQGNDYFKSETTDWNIIYKFGSQKSSLARLPEDEERFPVSIWVRNVLSEGIQFLQLNSNVMRGPCRPDLSVNFKTDGSNLPKVIQHLMNVNPESFQRWLKHIQTALPEIENIQIKIRPEDRYLYLNIKHKNGLELPSWVISDGTLRLLAQTLIAYLPEKNRIYMIEEPENGLHPLAIESVFQSLSSVYENQIFLATHSPLILRLAKVKDLLCFSKTNSGAVDIVRGENHPKLKNWQDKVDIATLHGAGILQ
jgi:predicted ATPase